VTDLKNTETEDAYRNLVQTAERYVALNETIETLAKKKPPGQGGTENAIVDILTAIDMPPENIPATLRRHDTPTFGQDDLWACYYDAAHNHFLKTFLWLHQQNDILSKENILQIVVRPSSLDEKDPESIPRQQAYLHFFLEEMEQAAIAKDVDPNFLKAVNDLKRDLPALGEAYLGFAQAAKKALQEKAKAEMESAYDDLAGKLQSFHAARQNIKKFLKTKKITTQDSRDVSAKKVLSDMSVMNEDLPEEIQKNYISLTSSLYELYNDSSTYLTQCHMTFFKSYPNKKEKSILEDDFTLRELTKEADLPETDKNSLTTRQKRLEFYLQKMIDVAEKENFGSEFIGQVQTFKSNIGPITEAYVKFAAAAKKYLPEMPDNPKT
jgi:hypothetical protein